MLTLKQIYDGKESIIAGLEKKHFNNAREVIEGVIAIDTERKAAQQKKDAASAEMNRISKTIGALMGQGKREEAEAAKAETAALKENIKVYEAEMEAAEQKQIQALLQIPNVPYSIVPEGASAEDNVAVKVGGWAFGAGLKKLDQPNEKAFSADGAGIALKDWPAEENPQPEWAKLPHWDLAKKYNLIDFDLGVKISGAGFPVYIGQGARLQRALINFFLAEANAAGYTEIMPPTVVNQASGYGTGQLPDKEGQMYHCEVDDLYLIPTAEVPVTNLYRDVIIDEKELPIKNCAYTECFRREAGSYGKDVRGLNRLHEFSKIEIVRIDTPEHSDASHKEMLNHVEGLLKKLELPYRILRLSGGDMSFTAALCYDFEVYSEAQHRWLEVSSTSNFDTYQANRLKCRYRSEADKKVSLAHTLNGSALALPRIVAALLENNQTEEGIRIPKALQPYFGADMIK
ncbi:MAG: serine--tRNA ligase [Paludibacteraceae bacterium]|jgi:seryl-tRNA synthetase|nr:serine--tRNA ligase [Paludibacteraceae bacterium]MBQ4390984.1 serine--tRNA ligase [Paludibacteraceae bacterium]